MLGIFDLTNGKTVMSKYEVVSDEQNPEVQYYLLEKPILLMRVKDPSGREGVGVGQWIGSKVELYPHAIAAANLDSIDKNIHNLYIEATTGIKVTPGNGPTKLTTVQ